MSIATMVGLGIQRHREATQPRAKAAAGDGDRASKTVDSAMEKVSAFIPSEVIGVYVAGFAILSPDTDTGKWTIFGICLALIPVIMLLNYLSQRKDSEETVSWKINLVLLVCAIVAFVAWATALPGTPFLSLHSDATAIGGWAVLVLAGVMYKLADILGIVPKTR